MSDLIGTYSFLPWLRQGIANNIKSADMDNSVKVRAAVNVSLTLKGEGIGAAKTETIARNVALYGPGDITGIESKAIIKAEPRNWITNFEPNYLPYIDFYDEDLPWRYTPAAPDTSLGRLRPWIMLAVLKEEEFEDGKNITNKPLPYFKIKSSFNASDLMPPKEQLWAWAHVHINQDIVKLENAVENTDVNSVLQRFQAVLNKDPDLAYSRIVSPRKLAPKTGYHAFLIPVFESGRLAGLGLDVPAATSATASAWDSGQIEFPYYYRWYFRTGTVGDFEYLVRLLQPKPVDSRVGRRDMDVQEPGYNISGITDADLGGILKLGGALQIPEESLNAKEKAEVKKYDEWAENPYPHPFQSDLASFINLADDYNEKEAPDANQGSGISNKDPNDPNDTEDPMITPPLYGRWHAMVERLLEERDGSAISPDKNWIHQLNLDPRWRVAAGFGTKVVQDKQEEYMDAAWGQVGEILEANRKIRLTQFATLASRVFYNKHIIPLRQIGMETALVFTAPVQKRIMAQGATVFHQVNGSLVPYATLSAPMRRILRPGSRLMRMLPFEAQVQPGNLIRRINDEEVFPAPPKKVPETVPTLDDLAEGLKPDNVPGFIKDSLSQSPWLQYLPLFIILLLVILLFILGFTWLPMSAVGALIAGSLYLFAYLRRVKQRLEDAESVLEENQEPEAVDKLPKSHDFKITTMGEEFKPTIGNADSPEAIRFKTALRDTYELVQLSGQAGVKAKLKPLDINLMVAATYKGIDPMITIPRLVLGRIKIPAYIFELIGETFTEAMAYPEFDIPMYKPLVDISSELFLPNINHIEQNSISLLETNQQFIESYMVGLNHEFARELLWREYPTDQRGSYFRQFWDPSGYLNTGKLDRKKLKEKLRDIPPLHLWSKFSKLGDHDHREAQGDKEEEAVLVIRGELLKKYPTAVIYAHRAEWRTDQNGDIDNKQERKPVELKGADLENPPRDKIKTPLYEAKVDPDIYFFGFDITIDAAKGDSGDNPGDDPGWFFVIKERPGEPRFGLDIDGQGDINVWNDLTWEKVVPGVSDGDFIGIDSNTPAINLKDPHCDPNDPLHDPQLVEKCEQYGEDKFINWNKNMNAAEVAYILYQVPVLVAIHASEMLSEK
ncbi:MAG: hypothetical protein GY940_39505 [bacterium]|nr:hypothetical protein [bacterium]